MLKLKCDWCHKYIEPEEGKLACDFIQLSFRKGRYIRDDSNRRMEGYYDKHFDVHTDCAEEFKYVIQTPDKELELEFNEPTSVP